MKLNYKKIFSLLLLIFILGIGIFYFVTLTYGDFVSTISLNVYFETNKALQFQFKSNITQILTINITSGILNASNGYIQLLNNKGQFLFSPQENCTIQITHNLAFAYIYINNLEKVFVSSGNSYNLYSGDNVKITFQMLGAEDTSGFWFKIGLGIISIGAIILAPFIANSFGKTTFGKIFILFGMWLFFGFLALQFIYMW